MTPLSISRKSIIFCLLTIASIDDSSAGVFSPGVLSTRRPVTCGMTLRRMEFGKRYLLRSPRRQIACRWRLQTDRGLAVKVTFLEVRMNPSKSNIRLVDIPQGNRFQWNTREALLPGRDIVVGQSFIYPGNVGGIIFEAATDSLLTVSYEAVVPEGQCGYTDFANGRVKQIKSPGFPAASYAEEMDCSWTLRARGRRRVNLVITSIRLDAGDDLKIYDGTNVIYSYQASPAMRNFISSSRKGFVVRFTAGASDSGRGFAAAYRYVTVDQIKNTPATPPLTTTAATEPTTTTSPIPQQRRAEGRECYSFSDNGAGYRGSVSYSKSGLLCQEWVSQYPHEHSRTPDRYLESGLDRNYCRNPDGESGPWCYTTDPDTPWELCDIPQCEECYDLNNAGSSYRGPVAETETGVKCQDWSSQTPHQHTRTKENYPGFGLESNYCRNPDGEDAPWCYTLSARRWAFCPIKACPVDCYDFSDSGATYRGKVSETETGIQCQKWSIQEPHAHSRTPDKHPRAGLLSNYCRNPDGSDRTWCYTTDPKIRWQYCNVNKCPESTSPPATDALPDEVNLVCYNKSDSGASYRGNMNVTTTGFKCQSWSSQLPHGHTRTAENYPNLGLEGNFCRNPDGEERPWCYTMSRTRRWQYCPVLACHGTDTSASTTTTTTATPPPTTTSLSQDMGECYDRTNSGASYRGNVVKTVSGFDCQKWSSQIPHKHTRTVENYPNSGLESNYCRNPDGEEAPWCYTMSSKRWEYCQIQACPDDDIESTTEKPEVGSMKPEITCYSMLKVTSGPIEMINLGVDEKCMTMEKCISLVAVGTLNGHEFKAAYGGCRSADQCTEATCRHITALLPKELQSISFTECNKQCCGYSRCNKLVTTLIPEPANTSPLDESPISVSERLSSTNYNLGFFEACSLKDYLRQSSLRTTYALQELFSRASCSDTEVAFDKGHKDLDKKCKVDTTDTNRLSLSTEDYSDVSFTQKYIGALTLLPWMVSFGCGDKKMKDVDNVFQPLLNLCGVRSAQSIKDIQITAWMLTRYLSVKDKSGFCKDLKVYRGNLADLVLSDKCAWKNKNVDAVRRSGLRIIADIARNSLIGVCKEMETHTSEKVMNPQPVDSKVSPQECYSSSDNGAGYRGTASMTKSGLQCQNWNSQFPIRGSRTSNYYREAGLESNYCRNPDGESAPWCFTTDANTPWELCDVPKCKECYDKRTAGSDYRGDETKSITGFPCQQWISQAPHQHTRTNEIYPGFGLVDNYCRNPDGEQAPWCYTLSQKRWEYCNVEACPADCYDASDRGTTYRGTVSKTETGLNCQEWSSQLPHAHTRTSDKYPHSGLSSNYCRNPDGAEKPWCFTTDPKIRWQYCNVERCEESKEPMSPPAPRKASKDFDCHSFSDKGAGYRGNVRVTKSGFECQSWNSQYPHEHNRTPKRYPENGLDGNYCRNPDRGAGPWCYTTDPSKRWELCDIPQCDECYDKSDAGLSYRGLVRQTLSGFECQDWSSQKPHPHTRTPENYPGTGLVSNYCRNPDQEHAPWCYTLNLKRWGYCAIETCPADCYDPSDSGATYRGSESQTETGLECQEWSSQTPHKHPMTSMRNPRSGLKMNYCRNPDGGNRPWCYTTDPNIRWQYCKIGKCTSESKSEPTSVLWYKKAAPLNNPKDCYVRGDDGAGYRGKVAVTKSGRRCQSWISQYPHQHSRTPDRFTESGLVNNYCRNPDGEEAPWCFTTDPSKRWEYCGISECLDCFNKNDSGSSYRGKVAQTLTGYQCQSWSSQFPNIHTITPENYPHSGLDDNYCRNPDQRNGQDTPWCYTLFQADWEYCPVQACPADCYDAINSGATYRGSVSVTESGRKCQNWSAQTPHQHKHLPNSTFVGLEMNYCRNPGGLQRPWCYTTDPNMRWEYCSVSSCEDVAARAEEEKKAMLAASGISCYHSLTISSGSVDIINTGPSKTCQTTEKCISIASTGTMDGQQYEVSYRGCVSADHCKAATCGHLRSLLPVDLQSMSFSDCDKQCCGYSRCNKFALNLRPDPMKVMEPLAKPMSVWERMKTMKYDMGFFKACSLRDYLQQISIRTMSSLQDIFKGNTCRKTDTTFDRGLEALDIKCQTSFTDSNELSLSMSDYQDLKFVQTYIGTLTLLPWTVPFGCGGKDLSDVKDVFKLLTNLCGASSVHSVQDIQTSAWMLMRHLIARDQNRFCRDLKPYQDKLINFVSGKSCAWRNTNKDLDAVRPSGLRIIADIARNPLLDVCEGFEVVILPEMEPPVLRI